MAIEGPGVSPLVLLVPTAPPHGARCEDVARTFADAVRLGRDRCNDDPRSSVCGVVVSVTRPGAIYAGQARTRGGHTLLVRFAFAQEDGQYGPVAHLLTSAIFWGAQQARAEWQGKEGREMVTRYEYEIDDAPGSAWGGTWEPVPGPCACCGVALSTPLGYPTTEGETARRVTPSGDGTRLAAVCDRCARLRPDVLVKAVAEIERGAEGGTL